MKPVKIERLAREDIIESAEYISDDNPEAAVRFLDAIEKASGLLSEQPMIGSPRHFSHTKLKNLRIWPVRKFENYLIVYRADRNSVKILRVLNARRDFAVLFDL